MPASSQSYSTESFEELAGGFSTGASICLVFVGGDKQERQEALGTLTDHLPYNLHQVQADMLIGERNIETQGNLRETLDSTGEAEGNILVFENADALYELPGSEDDKQTEEEGEEEAMTPVEYLFERIGSFEGVVVLCFQNRKYAEHASRQDAVDYAVTF